MVEPPPNPWLVVLLGPTASGKTSLSMDLARRFHGEIVSCDSVAIYRGLEIGTAKPTQEERREIPHHLIDVAPLDSFYTAGDYSRAARAAIAGITARGNLPIVTGGTGLYLRALLAGLFAGPQRSDSLRNRLRRRIEIQGPTYLHRLLTRLDPSSSARIHPNDHPKVIRAIEVSLRARQPMSEAWQAGREPLTGHRILRIGLAPRRELLYARINARAGEMFAAGLLEETQKILDQYGSGPAPSALNSLGYRQAVEHLRGKLSLEQAIESTRQAHRNYAKRQLTWFRREPGVHWLDGFGDEPGIRDLAEAEVDKALGDSS